LPQAFQSNARDSHSYTSLERTIAIPRISNKDGVNPLPPMSLVLNTQKHAIKNNSVLKMSFPGILPKIVRPTGKNDDYKDVKSVLRPT